MKHLDKFEKFNENQLDSDIFKHNPEDFDKDDVKRYYNGTVTINKTGEMAKVMGWEKPPHKSQTALRVELLEGENKGKQTLIFPSEVELIDEKK